MRRVRGGIKDLVPSAPRPVPRTVTREGHRALGGAVVAPVAGEAVSPDHAAEVGAEVLLDPPRNALAP
jgi:hypothetical protein